MGADHEAALPVRVGIHGCDDSTYVDLDVTPAERAFLDRLAAASTEASDYGCQPTIEIETRGPEHE